MFDPSGNALLSAEAQALAAAPLAAQARLAESLLRLDAALFETLPASSVEARAWASAVALQINYQLENREALAHEMLGDRQTTYRRDRTAVSPGAAQLARDYLDALRWTPDAQQATAALPGGDDLVRFDAIHSDPPQ